MEIKSTGYVHEWDSYPKSLFPKCVHPTLSPEEQHCKKWLKSGSVNAFLCTVVLQDALLQESTEHITRNSKNQRLGDDEKIHSSTQ